MTVPAVQQDLSRYNVSAGGSTTPGVTSAIAGVKIVNTMASAYAIPSADQVQGMQVYDKATGRTYLLQALPASTASNWIVQGDGDAEDSYVVNVGNFDPLIATRKCNLNQTITGASLPPSKVYKIIATADIVVTFNLPILASSPMINGMAWSLRSGDELTFYKTSDGSAIDGDVK